MQAEELYIALTRGNGIPLYVQIKDAIRGLLTAVPPEDEFVLPAQRDLAARLGVSRNTVGMAYAALEREGLVVSRVGRGTVAVDQADRTATRSRQDVLRRTIAHSVEEALALGFNLEDYAAIVGDYVQEKKRMLDHTRLVFVECNREQLTYFADHLSLGPGVVTVPLLLSEMREQPKESLSALESADVVVTSFYHVDELERFLDGSGPPVVAINLQPEMSTIVQLARIPADAAIGLVASSRQFVAEIGKTLRQVGIDLGRVRESVAPGGPELDEFVRDVEVLVASPSRRREVEALAGDRPVVEFLFAPDDTSIRHIRVALVELRRRQEGSRGNARTDGGTDVP